MAPCSSSYHNSGSWTPDFLCCGREFDSEAGGISGRDRRNAMWLLWLITHFLFIIGNGWKH